MFRSIVVAISLFACVSTDFTYTGGPRYLLRGLKVKMLTQMCTDYKIQCRVDVWTSGDIVKWWKLLDRSGDRTIHGNFFLGIIGQKDWILTGNAECAINAFCGGSRRKGIIEWTFNDCDDEWKRDMQMINNKAVQIDYRCVHFQP